MILVNDNMNVGQGNSYGVETRLGKILRKD